jgi:hypothetical protein
MNHRFETVKVLHGNHNTMCKFQDQSESGYVAYKAALAKLMSPIITMDSSVAASPVLLDPNYQHVQEVLQGTPTRGLCLPA